MPGLTEACRTAPELSVVIASYNSLATVDACLCSLRRQKTSRPLEIILVDSSTDGTGEHVRRRYPEVVLLVSPQRLYCGDARNRALEVARAPVIAFLDADCYVEEGWAGALLKAHRSPHWLIGGTVDNGSRKSLCAWAYYFCEFSLWLPRTRPAQIAEVAGGCLSIKREAFERYGPFLAGTYCSDTAFQWRARRDGHRALLSPAIRVFHTCEPGVRELLAHVSQHRRFFAQVARSQRKIEGWRRRVLVIMSPLYPFLLLALTSWRVLRRPRYLGWFLLCSPLVFLGCCARAWGELTGLAAPMPAAPGALPAHVR
jgi:GT2 family glycosyltransferase